MVRYILLSRFQKDVADIIILWLFKLGITMLIHNKDDIEFVTEFPCFLGHPVYKVVISVFRFWCLYVDHLPQILIRELGIIEQRECFMICFTI